MGILPNGVAIFLVNHGRDARATFGDGGLRKRSPCGEANAETGRRPVLHGNGWRQKSGMKILPNGVAVFLVNHGRDARATLGTAVFASEALR